MEFPISMFPKRLMNQDFGTGISPEDLIVPLFGNYSSNYYRPWKWHTDIAKDVGSTVIDEKDKFSVSLDVQQFKPNEISVKVVNGEIIIEGKHEERKDEHGYISRHFQRRYSLPKECNSEDVESKLSSDGVLMITAKKPVSVIKNERKVPIQFCDATIKKIDKNHCTTNGNSEVIEKAVADQEMKKNTQIMLKEDHSRLLKPEFMKNTSEVVEKLAEKLTVDQTIKEESQSKEEIKIKTADSMIAADALTSEKTTMATIKEKIGETSMSETKSFMSMTSTSEMKSEESSSFVSSSISANNESTTEILNELIKAELKEAAEII